MDDGAVGGGSLTVNAYHNSRPYMVGASQKADENLIQFTDNTSSLRFRQFLARLVKFLSNIQFRFCDASRPPWNLPRNGNLRESYLYKVQTKFRMR